MWKTICWDFLENNDWNIYNVKSIEKQYIIGESSFHQISQAFHETINVGGNVH